MKPDSLSPPPNRKKLKIIYGWYIYAIYALLIFNIYMAVYNLCVRRPFERPLLSLIHSLFIALMLRQVLKKKVVFAWLMLAYFILMRLYYANALHVEFDATSRGLVLIILTLLLTGTVAVGQLATPPLRQDWLAQLGWKQWATLATLAAVLTPLITTDYWG
ncbi:Uncharacterised protein [Serratia entomophila]|jgi:phosphoglycerol transferase MdoB-like AlkP superfamily enzyme|uniref:hypothetical protein n=1 Tax=Serratia entomophila TaxID=42906 RepID=UPI001F1F83F6|nr:hypothetical protein [Serratia entomophila]UIW16465.1 hypothetical protein KHA73_13525 [Serratia entomophila]CAI0774337.1 Uncharacterised protein [Serratia entomophila]CAI1015295.1 Uncharacterised protein [Serratia entomophila]CAI1130292.1 Uncharacterised protein [Serratia entomophila]CAI1131698.1 Uncharacterised protein [Serratia entomophila]